MEKKVTSHVIKGLIISLIIIVLSIIGNFMDMKTAQYAGYVGYLVLFVGVILACTSYGKQMDHRVTFGNLFAHGFKTTAVVTVIVIAFTIVFFLIFPEMKEKALDAGRQAMEEKNMPDEQIETAMNIMSKSFMLFLIMGALFGYLMIGLVASLIGAGVTKKNPPTPFETQG